MKPIPPFLPKRFLFLGLMLACLSTLAPAQTPLPTAGSSPEAKITAKLGTIILPRVDFKETTLAAVLEILTVESKKADPAHEGVHFSMQVKDVPVSKPVTLELINIHLADALRYSLALSAPQLQSQIVASGVIIIPKEEKPQITKTFVVADGFIQPPSAHLGDARQQLLKKGVKFPEGASAVYVPEKKSLTVKNDADQMELIEELVIAGISPTIQVKINTKFIEIDQTK